MRIKTADSTLTLHQSAIGSFLKCPEQFRQSAGILPGGDIAGNPDARVETDAATAGTVIHTVIETDLQRPFKTIGKLQAFAKKETERLIQSYHDDGLVYIQSSFGQNPQAIYGKVAKLADMWFHSQERQYWQEIVRDHPDCFQFEMSFDVPFIKNRQGRYTDIRLAGTMDVVDLYNHRLVDWKTSGRDKQPWEESRWNVQATVYTYAAAELGLLKPHDDGNFHFELIVFNHKNNEPEPQHVQVLRSENNWAWLVEVVSQMVTQIESDLPIWQMNDQHALCSPVWCPVWSDCKGKYISGEKQVWS